MTVTTEGADFAGAGAAIAGEHPPGAGLRGEIAHALGMRPVEIAQADRAAYHAAASIASNFLITLEAAAERVAGAAGVERAQLVPLVRATVESARCLPPLPPRPPAHPGPPAARQSKLRVPVNGRIWMIDPPRPAGTPRPGVPPV